MREVSEVTYIQSQSRVLMAFREGSTVAHRWIKARGKTELLAAVATARAAFLEHGFTAIQRGAK